MGHNLAMLGQKADIEKHNSEQSTLPTMPKTNWPKHHWSWYGELHLN